MTSRFFWSQYKYLPYEKDLAQRELSSLFPGQEPKPFASGIELAASVDLERARRSTYFAEVDVDGEVHETYQHMLESTSRGSAKKQATRYSVHGIHEYKGKFNPQSAKALLNIFQVSSGDRVLDPFCGSGTTLVEARHLGANAFGTDINPFAVFLTSAKLTALNAKVDALQEARTKLLQAYKKLKPQRVLLGESERVDYLSSWFEPNYLQQIEAFEQATHTLPKSARLIWSIVASNLLRDYSLQDPNDLRIRRRPSAGALPDFSDAFELAADAFLERLASMREVVGHVRGRANVRLQDVSQIQPGAFKEKFDAAITSPPYAMALPYIDTQRLSLVWLSLAKAKDVLRLESTLIGSRETKGFNTQEMTDALDLNSASLPEAEFEYCRLLNNSISGTDGFRRRAVPTLLYRYFGSMMAAFAAVKLHMKDDAPFALIVGHNKTTLGGKVFEIDTPQHLANLACSVGWRVEEVTPLQTYKRYGYHAANAVAKENLIVLRA